MQAFNTYFYNEVHLQDFTNSEEYIAAAQNASSILVQIYSGSTDETAIQSVIEITKKLIPTAEIIGATTSGEILDGKISTEKIILSINIFQKQK